MIIAAIIFFFIAVVAAAVILGSYLFGSGDAGVLRRADNMLNELGEMFTSPPQDSIAARIEASIRLRIKVETEGMTQLVRKAGESGEMSPEDVRLLRQHVQELEKWSKLIRSIRDKSELCTDTAQKLLAATVKLFMSMAEAVRDKDPDAADNFLHQIELMHKCRGALSGTPLALTLAVISVLTRIEGVDGDGDLAYRARQLNEMIDRYKGIVREDAMFADVPRLLHKFNKVNVGLLKAVERCVAVLQRRSRFVRFMPSLKAIPKRYVSVLDAVDKISSAIH